MLGLSIFECLMISIKIKGNFMTIRINLCNRWIIDIHNHIHEKTNAIACDFPFSNKTAELLKMCLHFLIGNFR